VFLNSHLLSEVEITCDRVAFIKHGEVLETRELRGAEAESMRVSIRARKLSAETITGLSLWASSLRLEGERLSFTVTGAEVLPEILRFLVGRGVDVFEVTPQRTSLEEMFLQIVGTDGGL
jgi:ABC-2 type transport system ATP-binding protein